MNFSTFFIDKLSGTSPELSMGTKRPLIGSYMFSDIIKVYEDETSKKTVLQSNSEINPKDETLPPTDNVIQVSADDLSELFQFINSFITSNPEMQSTESNYKIDSTEISKKQFVVDGEQLTQFINGLVNKISNNSEIISNNEQNDFYGKELSIVFKTDPGKITLNITPLKKVDTENPVVIDKMLGSLQSLISADKRDGNIAAINNLSKLFPSDETNGNDVNKNTEEIENVEDQLKQKLFYKAEVIQILVQGKNDWLKDNEEQTITNSAEKTPVVEFNYAKNFQSSELSPGNLVDISQNNKPYGNIGQNQFDNNESAFKILNGLQGEKIVNPYDISIKAATGENVIKPLNIFSQNNIDVNNLIKELNVKQVSININNQSVYEKKSEPVEFVSGKINPEKMLEKNGIDIKKTESNTGKLEVKPESNNEIKSDFQKAFNGLKNLEKEDLKFVIPSKGYKNSDSKPTVDESILTNESINEEHKVIVKVSAKQIIKIANENSVESTSINSTSTTTTGNNNVTAKNIMKDNTVKVTVGSEAAVNLNIKPTVKENTVSENKEVQGVETIRHDNDKQEKQTLRDTDFTRQENKDQSKYTAHETFKNTVTTGNNNVTAKNIINDNTVNEKKEAQSVETIRHDNDKQEKQTLRDTDFTRQENKDQSKYTAHETFKNSVQQMQTSSIDFDTEKIKLFSDVKTMQETVKNIKTNDLIPEFSKLILQGEKQSMTFQLSPENLGKVKLSIEMVNNQIFTRIEVENENIKQFIQSNIEQLKHNLQQEGIKYSSVNISLADYDQRPTKSFVQKKKYNNHNDKEQMIEELVNAPHKKMGYNTYEYLA